MTNDTADIFNLPMAISMNRNLALNGQAGNFCAVGIAEQPGAICLRSRLVFPLNIQIGNGVSAACKGTAVLYAACTDAGEVPVFGDAGITSCLTVLTAFQIDVRRCRGYAVRSDSAAAQLLSKPEKLTAVGDLIHAIYLFRRLKHVAAGAEAVDIAVIDVILFPGGIGVGVEVLICRTVVGLVPVHDAACEYRILIIRRIAVIHILFPDHIVCAGASIYQITHFSACKGHSSGWFLKLAHNRVLFRAI